MFTMKSKRRPMVGALALSAAMAAALAQTAAPPKDRTLGYDDTPMLPGLPYRVHDIKRPHPRVVTPGPRPGGAPSDAIVLFDGTDLSHWTKGKTHLTGTQPFHSTEKPEWKLENGYVEVVPGKGDMATKEVFGDCQLHVEWAAAAVPEGTSQGRGNSGVFMMGRYEIEILDPITTPLTRTAKRGRSTGSGRGWWNPSTRPGEWQTYYVVWESPKFDGARLVKPAYLTLFMNGVVLHNRKELMSPTKHAGLDVYAPQPAEDVIVLQNHNNKVRFRNIWVRRLGTYDEPETARR